jgi:hypothetical protein
MKKLLALALITSAITVFQSSGAKAAGIEMLNDGTPFQAFPDYQGFEYFLQAQDTDSDLLKVTSDAMNGVLMLKTVVDSNLSLQELKYVTSENITLDMHLNDLANGILLMKSGKYDVLKLVGHDLSSETGGNLDLVYLSDGVWNIYKTFPMSLTRSGNHWELQTRAHNQAGVSFNSMYLKRKTFFGKAVGIESVTVNQR